MELSTDIVISISLGVVIGQAIFASLVSLLQGILVKRATEKAKVNVEEMMAEFKNLYAKKDESA